MSRPNFGDIENPMKNNKVAKRHNREQRDVLAEDQPSQFYVEEINRLNDRVALKDMEILRLKNLLDLTNWEIGRHNEIIESNSGDASPQNNGEIVGLKILLDRANGENLWHNEIIESSSGDASSQNKGPTSQMNSRLAFAEKDIVGAKSSVEASPSRRPFAEKDIVGAESSTQLSLEDASSQNNKPIPQMNSRRTFTVKDVVGAVSSAQLSLEDASSLNNKPIPQMNIRRTFIQKDIIRAMSSAQLFKGLTKRATRKKNIVQESDVGDEITTVESLQFDFKTIKAATQQFSVDNKLGKGSFGEVYKGTLPNGQEIAVRRLSRRSRQGASRQGASQFKNEKVLMAKLQHRNLVRLQGFCLEGEEKILVYEFVPNKSLCYFLFDPERQGQLDWSRRYKIVGGIARGILYLHEDSRLRIIHRDLTARNILLDADMNPKISDFGWATIFGVDQTQGSTDSIVGTLGYMAPEYAFHGQFSVKSDVYSFGVLILEIISGSKNSSCQSGGATNLASYVWKHWRDGTPLEVLDPTLTDSYSRNEVIRCLHIGLLCVQEDPSSRPTMATIVLMLNSYSVTLPLPQQPAYVLHSRTESGMLSKDFVSDDLSRSKSSVTDSVDEAPITEVYPR